MNKTCVKLQLDAGFIINGKYIDNVIHLLFEGY